MPRSVPHSAPHPRCVVGPIATSIRSYRLKANLTQETLASRIGLRDRSTLSIWELGWRMPKLSNALRLAKELGTLVESLYWNSYAPNAPRPRGEHDHVAPDLERVDPAANLKRRYRRVTKRARFSDQLRLYKAVAREVRRCRRRAHLTPKQLADRMGVPEAAVRRIEQDDYHHGAALTTLLEVAAALGLRVQMRLSVP